MSYCTVFKCSRYIKSIAQSIEICSVLTAMQWHQRWSLSLEDWGCGVFLLCPVSQCRTGDNVSTVGINLPQLRAEIKAIHESGTAWHQRLGQMELIRSQSEQRRPVLSEKKGASILHQAAMLSRKGFESNEVYFTSCSTVNIHICLVSLPDEALHKHRVWVCLAFYLCLNLGLTNGY